MDAELHLHMWKYKNGLKENPLNSDSCFLVEEGESGRKNGIGVLVKVDLAKFVLLYFFINVGWKKIWYIF